MGTRLSELYLNQQTVIVLTKPAKNKEIFVIGLSPTMASEQVRMERKEEERQGPSVEQASEQRSAAQQSSMEAIRAAEERYQKAKDSALQGIKEKGGAFKDTTVEKGLQAKNFAAQKGKAAKDAAQGAVGYVEDRAIEAKDLTMETGEVGAELSGKLGGGMKYEAFVAGWGAAQYTLETAAKATHSVAGVTSNVVGYTGQKVVAGKDMVVGAGQAMVNYAGEKLTAAKEAVVAGEERAAEFAARKKEAAQKDLEAKKALDPKRADEDDQMPRQGGGGVLQSIGRSLVDIGQCTKGLVVGQYPIQVLEQKENEAAKDQEDAEEKI